MDAHVSGESPIALVRRRLFRIVDKAAEALRAYHAAMHLYRRKILYHQNRIKKLEVRRDERCGTLLKRLAILGELAYRDAAQHKEALTRERKTVRSDAGNAFAWRASEAIEVIDEEKLIEELQERGLFKEFVRETIEINKAAMRDKPDVVATLTYAKIAPREKFVILADGIGERLETRLGGDERQWEVVDPEKRKKA